MQHVVGRLWWSCFRFVQMRLDTITCTQKWVFSLKYRSPVHSKSHDTVLPTPLILHVIYSCAHKLANMLVQATVYLEFAETREHCLVLNFDLVNISTDFIAGHEILKSRVHLLVS